MRLTIILIYGLATLRLKQCSRSTEKWDKPPLCSPFLVQSRLLVALTKSSSAVTCVVKTFIQDLLFLGPAVWQCDTLYFSPTFRLIYYSCIVTLFMFAKAKFCCSEKTNFHGDIVFEDVRATCFWTCPLWFLLPLSFYSLWAVCSFSRSIRCKVRLFIWDFSCFWGRPVLLWISLLGLLLLCPIHFGVVFSFSFVSRYFLNLFLDLIVNLLFSNTLFSLHVVVCFSVFLWLISSFMSLWSEKMLYMISVFLNLLWLVLWPNMWSILENVPYALKKMYIVLFEELL